MHSRTNNSSQEMVICTLLVELSILHVVNKSVSHFVIKITLRLVRVKSAMLW